MKKNILFIATISFLLLSCDGEKDAVKRDIEHCLDSISCDFNDGASYEFSGIIYADVDSSTAYEILDDYKEISEEDFAIRTEMSEDFAFEDVMRSFSMKQSKTPSAWKDDEIIPYCKAHPDNQNCKKLLYLINQEEKYHKKYNCGRPFVCIQKAEFKEHGISQTTIDTLGFVYYDKTKEVMLSAQVKEEMMHLYSK